ncbi:MAG: ATP-dependent Clp protease ATP-binding subunit [Clostridiales bacterium]|nr:ATP-dependent Clp protease ATP-binding subunit [Clostridiales bacterium]
MAIFGRFTERTQRVLNAAGREAAEGGTKYIGPEHLLLGLLAEDDRLPPEIEEKITYDDVKEMLSDMHPDPEGIQDRPMRMEMAPRTKKIIETAVIDSNRVGQGFVTPEHLWLAILKTDDGMAANFLHRKNVQFAKAMEETLQMLRENLDGNGNAPSAEPGRSEESETGPQKSTPSLARYSRNLTELAQKGELDPVIGRDNEIQRIMQILIRRTKNNPVLIGEPGVGKSAVVEGLAERIVQGNVPEMLIGKKLLSLDLASMVAGSKYRGEFEERIKKCLEEIRRSKDIILFIDEMHTIVGAGAAEGSLDAANILKPALARGEIQCIGATTLDEYRKHIEKDAALERRFQSVMVGEPTQEEAVDILKGLRDRYEAHHKLHITDQALEAAVHLSERYISDRCLPDKAIDLMDEACSRVRIESYTAPPDVKEQEQKLSDLIIEKKDAIAHQDFEKAANLRDQERQLRAEIEKKRDEWNQEQAKARDVVNEEDIAQIVASWTGIPAQRMTQTEAEKLMHLEDTLHERLIGQEEAVSAVARAIRRARAGLKDPKRPIGSFLFLGPTGVGKTELCRALGEAMFGDENAVIRIDMSEYMEKFTTSRLVGAAPGYVGYEEGGQLTEAVRRKPYAVVLLDEIEKAHPDVFNILLQILEDGRLTDNTGRTISFKNTIIVMTSNAGAHQISESRSLGFGSKPMADLRNYEMMKDAVMKEVKEVFRPEFINRLDELIVFHSLSEENIQDIARLMLRQVADLLRERNVSLSWEEDVVTYLGKTGYDPKFGARPLRRLIQRTVEDTISEEMLAGNIQLGENLRLYLDDKSQVRVSKQV